MDQADCWHRVGSRENWVAFTGASLGLAEAVKALPELGPQCSQILAEPVACHSPAKTGAHLWNTVHLRMVAEWVADLCRIKACEGHKCIALCQPEKNLISPARLNSTHISQANSGSHWSPLHFLWNNDLVLDHRLVCTLALNYRTCFDSATNKTKIS